MGVFKYKAIEPGSKKVQEGVLEAGSLKHAREQLRNQGLVVQLVNEVAQRRKQQSLLGSSSTKGRSFLQKMFQPVGVKDLHLFCQQMSMLLMAGLPLIECLFILEQQTTNTTFASVLQQLRNSIVTGQSLTTALINTNGVFNRLFIAMIQAGEKSGRLAESFASLEVILNRYLSLKGKLISAVTYPTITLLVMVVVAVGMVIFVIPQLEGVLEKQGKELPWITQSLLLLSKFIRYYYGIIIVGLVGGIWSLLHFSKHQGKALFAYLVLNTPVIGKLIRDLNASRFALVVGNLLRSGVPIQEALRLSEAIVSNYLMQQAIQEANRIVLQGGKPSRSLEDSRVFPLFISKMMAVGEETGAIDTMLLKAAEFMDKEVELALNTLAELVQPVMTIIISILMLYFVLAIYVPIFNLSKVG
jgi:general secretion pathway protein F